MNTTTWTRSKLLTLLSEASELEHGLACCYLYAAVSLKQELAEGGLGWEQLQHVRLWASQIFQVAAEEMFHLAQAWNLLTAIGGTPWYARPNFPQRSSYYPLHLPLEAQPFNLETIERFIAFEHPHDPNERPLPPEPGTDAPAFRTVGELYQRIGDGIQAIPEELLFVGNPDHQVGPDLLDFPNLTRIDGRAAALHAIETITEQGEGNRGDRDDSHYHTFQNIRTTYLEQTIAAEESGEPFQPVRPCIQNPATADPTRAAGNVIVQEETARVAETFDAIYMLMLRLLQYVFDNATGEEVSPLRPYAETALQLMTSVLKPLAEALTQMPAGASYGHATAGPPFTIGRNIPLPHDPAVAQLIATERVSDLQQRLTRLAADQPRPPQLRNAAQNFETVIGRTAFAATGRTTR